MRFRLIAILTVLMAAVLLALTVPLARGIAGSEQHTVYLDRLNDANRFAAVLQDAQTRDDLAVLDGELERYHEVHDRIVAVRVRFDDPASAAGAVEPPALAGLLPTTGTDVTAQLDAARHLKDGEPPAQIFPWDSRPLAVAVPARHNGQLVGAVLVVSDSRALRGTIGRLWALLILADLLVLIGCVALASRIASWILRPIVVLDGAAHRISSGELSARVPAAAGPVELRRLGTSFNEMGAAVEDSMRRQRAFVADASHQLRNPLSALMLRLGILGVGLPPEHAADLTDVQDEAERLVRIIDDLLQLATAEQVSVRRQAVDVVALVQERFAAWQPLAAEKHSTLRLVHAGRPVVAVADEVLVGTALDAVLDNAIKFGQDGGEVTVRVGPDGDAALIEVLDDGPGVEPDELARIGDRFWRSARHQNVEGTGLGLSIARHLIGLNEGDMTFGRREPRGFAVSVRLPAAGGGAGDGVEGAVAAHRVPDRDEFAGQPVGADAVRHAVEHDDRGDG
ncbi:MAG: HAMP domain-containing histidine kinase [Catenulispora sp.]|nr:HAMP domain-containing histidine kinase [Catenulispora sp.]